jgi:AICAR transformylase/IMP cyclohydrolase PurH
MGIEITFITMIRAASTNYKNHFVTYEKKDHIQLPSSGKDKFPSCTLQHFYSKDLNQAAFSTMKASSETRV